MDEFAQPGAQGVTGDIGTSGGQVLVEAGEVFEGHCLAEVGGGDHVGEGELAGAGTGGEAGESVDEGHSLGEVAVGAGGGGAEDRGDRPEVLGGHVVMDPR